MSDRSSPEAARDTDIRSPRQAALDGVVIASLGLLTVLVVIYLVA
ncbi:hypothetical protein [Halolamina salifodinae]|uniref:Uncharacterized protein n=1 Tax=Halolamina salifodinae TaxID=1202767 RepID=A0A8T4GS46_9EURY|nr:hypothetical protein [Halolamina salifodinae]MBP1985961.1 hypothetical protein [Halolamina salifodinae]